MQKFEIRSKILSFWAITRPKSENSKFRFLDFMRTVPRNIPMKFHRSNMKTEGGVRKSLNPDGRQTDRHTDPGDLSHTKTSHTLSHLCRYTGHLSNSTFCVYRENNSNRRNTSHVSVVAQLVAQVVTNCIYRTTYRTTCFVRSNRVKSV